MRLRDKILYGFLLFVAVAPLIQDLISGVEFGYDIVQVALNVLMGIAARVIPWYFIIKLLFWIYDRLRGLKKKETNP